MCGSAFGISHTQVRRQVAVGADILIFGFAVYDVTPLASTRQEPLDAALVTDEGVRPLTGMCECICNLFLSLLCLCIQGEGRVKGKDGQIYL